MDSNKGKKKENEQHPYEFCQACRLNHNQGRRHIYFPSHKSSVSALLTRFLSKLADITFFLKSPITLRPEDSRQNRFWCSFCESDILEHGSQFSCGNAINHLASGQHRKRVKEFMWKHGVGMERAEVFRISEPDFQKWERKCMLIKTDQVRAEPVGPVTGPLNNIHNELADSACNFDEANVKPLTLNITNDVMPLQNDTNEKAQVSCSVLPSFWKTGSSLHDMPKGPLVSEAEFSKTLAGGLCNHPFANSLGGHISNESVRPGGIVANGDRRTLETIAGNVYTGAPPPWFDATEGYQIDLVQKPVMSEFVTSKAGKSSRLNPKRDGAAWAEQRKREMELEQRGELVSNEYDPNWLPNFGRMWQSGTRKDSRKEFQMENKASAQMDNPSESSAPPLQPYISKRMVIQKSASGILWAFWARRLIPSEYQAESFH